MNSLDLSDALNAVSEKRISEAAGKRRRTGQKAGAFFRRHPKIRLAAAAALFLALVLIVQTAFGPALTLRAYALERAEYPSMQSAGPLGLLLHPKAGDYEQLQHSLRGSARNLGNFFSESISACLQSETGQNTVMSPLCLYLSLAMLAEISGGETRQQILEALNTESLEALREQAYRVWNANYLDNGPFAVIPASSLWLNKDLRYRPEVLKTLAENYFADSFRGAMGSAKYNKALSDWLNRATGNLLSGQTEAPSTDPGDAFSLVSALCFQSKWAREFHRSASTEGVFHAASGEKTATFMKETSNPAGYYWGDHFSACCKYLKNGTAFWMILPDADSSPEELLRDENCADFLAYLSQGERSPAEEDTAALVWENKTDVILHLALPRFDAEYQCDLKPQVQAMGITDCFDMARADFGPLTEEAGACVSAIRQGARIITDEEGIRAAAYVSVNGATAMAPAEKEVFFTLDRPFLFVMISSDGLPLFSGVIREPG